MVSSAAHSQGSSIHVAIVGGGITGVILALALQKRGVNYTLYERAPTFTEIGAGIGFSPNAERALTFIDPEVHRVYKQVASSSKEKEYFQWVDGHRSNEIVARLLIGVDSFQGGRRYDFLEAWSKLIPRDKIKFYKEIVSIADKDTGGVSLHFRDGTVDKADIVVGCDGIHSRVRQLILGESNSASYPSYTNKYCFRTLVPMDNARAALGDERTVVRFFYNGPGAHCVTYPVAQGQFLNLLLVISDPNPWCTEDDKHTAPGEKAEAIQAYADWHPHVRALVELLPEELQKWAIFDMFEKPAPCYYQGNVAIAGDAAHAAGPHLGSGAGFGIEDALVLATVLEAANEKFHIQSRELKRHLCHAALATYNAVRYERTQWLIGATRDAGALFHWQYSAVGNDPEKFLPEISSRFHTIWDYDIGGMVSQTLTEFEEALAD
ncbi:hypothetical protein AAE478_009040 [Parahypoxylon ruwenzoriense]